MNTVEKINLVLDAISNFSSEHNVQDEPYRKDFSEIIFDIDLEHLEECLSITITYYINKDTLELRVDHEDLDAVLLKTFKNDVITGISYIKDLDKIIQAFREYSETKSYFKGFV